MSLLVSDAMSSLGGAWSLKWVIDNSARCGSMCDAQAILKTIGDPGTAMATLAITIHTFFMIAFSWRPDQRDFRIPFVVVFISWTYRLGFVSGARASALPGKTLFAPSPYWCWISDHYNFERIPATYLWYWLTAGVSIVLYVPLYFVIRRNLDLDRERPWRLSVHRAPQLGRVGGSSTAKLSLKVLLYPAAYLVTIVPNSVMRLIDFNGTGKIPAKRYFLCISLFNLGGLVNVLLLLFTRSNVLGFHAKMPKSAENGSPQQRGPRRGRTEENASISSRVSSEV
ncbi:hypothetical protein EXIGLDRAFT_460065 [Exidia glandulosa HHB12029]|uniref:Uncharacterized protein n=1 Tax=Exidia glandulosa HHB12029 TaxID=1314781 RepID=A0A165K5L5_EXIGL|nr:hypothetical protein EXIGLDRAFT_460065 [Exidia glandulosa HHB12029]